MDGDKQHARVEEEDAGEQRYGRSPVQRMGPDHQPWPARSSPPPSSTGRDVRTEMWLEQHKDQMRGGQFPPGFVRAPSASGPHYQQHLRPHHPRSGSYGGNSHSQTRNSSPSQWSLSQHSHSQCVTPRSGASGSMFQGAKNQRVGGLSSSLPRSHHGGDRSSGYRQMGTATPPALQITSPVTPRDFSSGYNSPRASEDLQRYTSDEFVYGGQTRQRRTERGRERGRERRSLDGLSGLSGGLSPHSGGRGSGTPNHENARSSFKSLVSYLDTRHNSASERSAGVATPRSWSSFDAEGEDGSDVDGECAAGSDGERGKAYAHARYSVGGVVNDDGDGMDVLVSQVKEKVSLFPGSFRDSLPLNSLQPEMTPFADAYNDRTGVETGSRRSAGDEESPATQSADRESRQGRLRHQQQPDVFSFPVGTLAPKMKGLLGGSGAATGSWPNFQSARGDADGADGVEDSPSSDLAHGSQHQAVPNHQKLEQTHEQTHEQSVEFEEMTLRIIHRKNTTGFEFQRELPLHVGDEIAGRFRIMELLGQAAFSRAVHAIDLTTGQHVCLKVVKNSNDYFDQSLDEIRLLRYVNECDPGDEQGIVRLYDYFYYAEHLILVTELLRANLYEFSKHDRSYFTPARLKQVASQLLSSVAYMHSLSLIHADLKPENILMKSYAACQIKLIDLGSSFFNHDSRISHVVQSRSYRAPEVILGCDYDYTIDVWSIGCILVELAVGEVLFNDCSGPQMLARMESVLGSMPAWMRTRGRFAKRYFLGDGRIFEQNHEAGGCGTSVLVPQPSSLNYVLDGFDKDMADFISLLLALDPIERISARDALQHPYLLDESSIGCH